MPEMSSPQLQATLEMPKDSKPTQIKKEADRAVERIQQVEEVETVGAMMNTSETQIMGAGSANTVSFYIMLKQPKMTIKEVKWIIFNLRRKLKKNAAI